MNATKTIVTKAFNKAALWFLIIVAAWSYACMTQGDGVSIDKPAPVGSYEQVMEANVCEDTVMGEFPTGAVIYRVGGGYEFTTNERLIGVALDEALGGKESKRIDPLHFCR